MPIRGYKQSNPNEWTRLNALLENAFKAEKDHRFVKLHKQKPIEDDWSRIFEYIPGQDSALGLDSLFKEPTMIAHMGVLRQPMQFGKSIILNGGVRDVATHRAVQGKGIGLLVARDAIKFMFENEVDISILFSGAGPFYEKSGWRGGFNYFNYHMSHDGILSLMRSSAVQGNSFEARILENSDFDLSKLAKLYIETNRGLYFAADRDKEYWKRHFETNPQIIWEFIGVFNTKGDLLGYFRYNLKQNARKIDVYVTECRISSFINLGTQEFDKILASFIKFLESEAIDSLDLLNEIHFELSPQHSIIGHLKQRFPTMKEGLAFKQNHMVLITNPYSLFRKIKDELDDRIAKHRNELGSEFAVAVSFDQTGKYPGGVIVKKTKESECINYEIFKNSEEFASGSNTIKDRIEFASISDLTIFFCNFIPAEEWDDDDLLEEMGVMLSGNGKTWLKVLFLGSDCAMYEMDHF